MVHMADISVQRLEYNLTETLKWLIPVFVKAIKITILKRLSPLSTVTVPLYKTSTRYCKKRVNINWMPLTFHYWLLEHK